MSKKDEAEIAGMDPSSWMEEFEGQLAIDVFETESSIIIKAPIAGVRPEDLDVTITEDLVTIRGERHDTQAEAVEGYLVQECYWGPFSRIYPLPVAVDSDKAQAKLTSAGILTIVIPKTAKSRAKSITVQLDQ